MSLFAVWPGYIVGDSSAPIVGPRMLGLYREGPRNPTVVSSRFASRTLVVVLVYWFVDIFSQIS